MNELICFLTGLTIGIYFWYKERKIRKDYQRYYENAIDDAKYWMKYSREQKKEFENLLEKRGISDPWKK